MTIANTDVVHLGEEQTPEPFHKHPDPLAKQVLDEPTNETPLPLNPQAGSGTFATSPKAQRAQRHQTYQWMIVVGLLGVMALATAAVMVLAVAASDQAWARLSSQLAFLITPIHTLVGIAVGYYFANEKRKR